MEFKLFIALFLATVLAFSAATDDDSNGSDSGSGSMGSWGDSFEERDDDCDRLVEGSDDNDGKCDLTDGLEEIPDKCDKCSSDDKTKIIEWISKLKIELKVKVSVEERLEIASASMLEFQMENPSVFGLIQFQNVSSWGWLVSFTKHIEIRQTKKVESLISLDDDDNCPLFDALFNCTDGSYEQESAVNALINETLLEICGDMTLSVTKKNKKIFEALSKFFSLHAEWQVSFFKYKIKGFGSFHQFFEITKTSYQITEVDGILEGEVEECSFMVSFKNQLELIKADATVSLTIKASLNQFYQRVLQALKAGGLKGKARLSIIIKQFNECFKLYDFLVEFLMTIEIEGFGSFLDLIFCGPGKLPHPPKPTLGPIVSSPKPTCSCTCGSTFMP